MGFKIFVNDEEVWDSGDDTSHTQVSDISASTAKGEAFSLRAANDIDKLMIRVAVRDHADNNDPLDMVEIRAQDKRRSAGEARGAEVVDEGRNMVTNDEKRRLLLSGDFARDEEGNPVKSDGKGGLEKLADASQLQDELNLPTLAGTAGGLPEAPEPTENGSSAFNQDITSSSKKEKVTAGAGSSSSSGSSKDSK